MALRVPAGRSGRLWLLHRQQVAQRAADLLERKRRALVGEQRRLVLLVARTDAAWRDAVEEAERWLGRALVVGGQDALTRAVAYVQGAAVVDASWRSTMGVVYPARISCTPAPDFPAASLGSAAALREARTAYAAALEAGAQHAAARIAATRVTEELSTTVRRLRVIERRWTPALHERLESLELQLDEREREDLVSARWALRAREIPRTGAS